MVKRAALFRLLNREVSEELLYLVKVNGRRVNLISEHVVLGRLLEDAVWTVIGKHLNYLEVFLVNLGEHKVIDCNFL